LDIIDLHGTASGDQIADLRAHGPRHHPRSCFRNVGTYLFMNWTADDGLATLVKLLYSQQKIKTFSQELKIIVTTSYYFALITIAAFSVAEVYKFVVGQIKSLRGGESTSE
jgi:hypothetical protein